MKRIGTFTIDELGRVAISSELRSMLEWQAGDRLSMFYVDSKTAILQIATEPNECVCDLCEFGDSVLGVKGYKMCRACVDKIVELNGSKMC